MFDATGVPLARAGERAERQHDDGSSWSPARTPARESKVLEATLHAMPLKGEPPSYLRPRPRMFKMPPSAFIEVVVDGGKPGTQTRDFGIDFPEVNSHQRRSRGCCSRFSWPQAAFRSHKSNWPRQADTRANDDQ